jgi:hypothetical protein
MAVAGIELSTGTAMIASAVLGLVVDDTIYYLAHYRHVHQGDAVAAIHATAHAVGAPITAVSVSLVLGFWVGALGSFKPTIYFSLLTGLTMITGVVCDLLVLPASLVVAERWKRRPVASGRRLQHRRAPAVGKARAGEAGTVPAINVRDGRYGGACWSVARGRGLPRRPRCGSAIRKDRRAAPGADERRSGSRSRTASSSSGWRAAIVVSRLAVLSSRTAPSTTRSCASRSGACSASSRYTAAAARAVVHGDGRHRVRSQRALSRASPCDAGRRRSGGPGRTELPDDVMNGLTSDRVQERDAGRAATVHFVAFQPKPLVLEMQIGAEGVRPVRARPQHRSASRFRIRPHVPGVLGALATVVGKQPPDLFMWIARGRAPLLVPLRGAALQRRPDVARGADGAALGQVRGYSASCFGGRTTISDTFTWIGCVTV